MPAIRVLAVMGLDFHSRRAMLEGFHGFALEQGWTVVRVGPTDDLENLVGAWDPAAILIDPKAVPVVPASFRTRPLISVFADRTAEGIASIVEDDEGIGAMAAAHLLEAGLKDFAAFAYNPRPFAVSRIAGFRRAVNAAGGAYHSGGEFDQPLNHARVADHLAVGNWLSSLRKPCGVFACCDPWARALAAHCNQLAIRMPEDVALLGAENDHLQCELSSPPISSISLPWVAMGRQTAGLVQQALREDLAAAAIRVSPTAVVVRRSSEIMAVDDPDVSQAVSWIRDHATEDIGVTDVLREIPVYRRKLERRFRAVLGRSIVEEIRRARVEKAKRLLAGTSLTMSQVALRSGFSSAVRLTVLFQKETGVTPGRYRRDVRYE